MCQCTHLLLHCRLSFTFTHFACSLHLCLILALCLSLFLVKWLRPVVEFSFAVHLARLRVPKQTHIFCFFPKKKIPAFCFMYAMHFFIITLLRSLSPCSRARPPSLIPLSRICTRRQNCPLFCFHTFYALICVLHRLLIYIFLMEYSTTLTPSSNPFVK